jgi:hypothetical protein
MLKEDDKDGAKKIENLLNNGNLKKAEELMREVLSKKTADNLIKEVR